MAGKEDSLPPSEGLGDEIAALFQSGFIRNLPHEETDPQEPPKPTQEQISFQESFMGALLAQRVNVYDKSDPREEGEKLWKDFPQLIEANAALEARLGNNGNAIAIKQTTLEGLAKFADRTYEDWGRRVGQAYGTPEYEGIEQMANYWSRIQQIAQEAWRLEQYRPRQ